MRARWTAIHATLVREASRLSVQTDYTSIRRRRDALGPYRDIAALMDGLHGPGGDPEARNGVLRDLIVEAQGSGQGDGGTAHAARVLLHLALWPGLDAVHRRLLKHFRSEPERLVSEITGRFSEGVATLDLDRVNRIAATLVRNVERDVLRMLQAEWKRAAATSTLDPDAAPPTPEAPSLFDLAPCVDPETAAERIAKRLRDFIGPDADLIVDIAVCGASQAEASAARGLGYEAGRKRYRRGLAKLRVRLAE